MNKSYMFKLLTYDLIFSKILHFMNYEFIILNINVNQYCYNYRGHYIMNLLCKSAHEGFSLITSDNFALYVIKKKNWLSAPKPP